LTLLSLFALLPRPLRPTLFPYTTLFRSTSCNAFKIDESIDSSGSKTRMRSSRLVVQAVDSFTGNRRAAAMSRCQRAASNHLCFRSEEHTSELQSRGHLVCRLLLEKKKK